MIEISIIIRTKDEEKWIGHCLSKIFQQDFKNFEVILVDNMSNDSTIKIAQRYPLANILAIENFTPGKALNIGINAAKGNFICCISAHCIPKNNSWLRELFESFDNDEKIAGVYGRQLPLSFTSDIDKRDLLTVFGNDSRVQVKDYFFHNANSLIRRDVLNKFPFDEVVSNIEDRVWAKNVITSGYKIIYNAQASVYHYHGLHQGNNTERARGVVSVIENMDEEKSTDLPDSLKPENLIVAAIIPIQEHINKDSNVYNLLLNAIAAAKNAKFVKYIYIISNQDLFSIDLHVNLISRDDIENASEIDIGELLKHALEKIEKLGVFPDSLLYLNYDFIARPPKIIDEVIYDAQYRGFDTVFPGFVDYGHYWVKKENDFYQTDDSMKSRAGRDYLLKALYGLGCLTSTHLIRTGKIIGGKIGILPITEFKYTLRHSNYEEIEKLNNAK